MDSENIIAIQVTKKFLRERAYPYMKETGIFLRELLEEREDGMLSLPVSSSPEIHDDTEKSC